MEERVWRVLDSIAEARSRCRSLSHVLDAVSLDIRRAGAPWQPSQPPEQPQGLAADVLADAAPPALPAPSAPAAPPQLLPEPPPEQLPAPSEQECAKVDSMDPTLEAAADALIEAVLWHELGMCAYSCCSLVNEIATTCALPAVLALLPHNALKYAPKTKTGENSFLRAAYALWSLTTLLAPLAYAPLWCTVVSPGGRLLWGGAQIPVLMMAGYLGSLLLPVILWMQPIRAMYTTAASLWLTWILSFFSTSRGSVWCFWCVLLSVLLLLDPYLFGSA
eukprot:m51a1_g11869 hypothetical protein (277) ;mRNA; f:532718-535528